MVFQGETVRIKATLTDFDGSALTPDTQSIQLYDPEDAASGSAQTSPTLSSTGVYYQDFDIAADADEGNWYVVWATTTSSKVGIGRVYFKVESET